MSRPEKLVRLCTYRYNIKLRATMKKIIIIVIIVGVIAAGFYMNASSGNEKQSIPVEVTNVQKAEIVQKARSNFLQPIPSWRILAWCHD